jgi:AcrR family transcriptional regulator
MPRHPDPDLEDRILNAAHRLWKRGGDKALTMRAVARAAGSNTPAVYRRFKDRNAIVRGLLLRTISRLGKVFEAGATIEDVAEAYIDQALQDPHEYELFLANVHALTPARSRFRPIREFRPNFALLEERLMRRLGGTVEDHTQLALAIWALAHGTTTLLLSKAVPEGHEEEMRTACRAAIRSLLEGAERSSGKGMGA